MSGTETTKTKGGGLPDRPFLSNLAKGISESQNLAGQYPGEAARLEKIRQEWVAELDG